MQEELKTEIIKKIEILKIKKEELEAEIKTLKERYGKMTNSTPHGETKWIAPNGFTFINDEVPEDEALLEFLKRSGVTVIPNVKKVSDVARTES